MASPWKPDFRSFAKQSRDKLNVRDMPGLADSEQFKTFLRANSFFGDSLIIINGTDETESAQGIVARYDLNGENETVRGARNQFARLDSQTVNVTK
jgi:hypothetical protein